MKTTMSMMILITIGILAIPDRGLCQIAVNGTGALPDNSAMLDVSSINKGLLVPRMTIGQRDAISTPATGLLVFCTDNNQYYTNKGTPAAPNWIMVSSQWLSNGLHIYYSTGNVGINEPYPAYPLNFGSDIGDKISLYGTSPNHYGFGIQGNQLQIHGDAATADITFGYGSSAAFTERMRVKGNGQVGIGTPTPAASAAVEISTTSKGFLPPRMTFVQRNAIANPVDGLIVFCTNCNTDATASLSMYQAGQWVNLFGNCTLPLSPPEGIHNQSNGQIIWNWSGVAIANGYKWGTSGNYATATDMGLATQKTETGLVTGTSYVRYVWAYNACGHSEATILYGQALLCGSSFTCDHWGTYVPEVKIVTYGTVSNIPGEISKCWITRNLGATQQPNQVSDDTEAAAGWYYQFNRLQGYKHDGTTLTPAWTTPWIEENGNWAQENDPCSYLLTAAWRLPTQTEWTNVDNAGGWTNWNGPWGSGLQIHAAGSLDEQTGGLNTRGIHGWYWSSNQGSAYYGVYLGTSSTSSGVFSWYKSMGATVRCIRD